MVAGRGARRSAASPPRAHPGCCGGRGGGRGAGSRVGAGAAAGSGVGAGARVGMRSARDASCIEASAASSRRSCSDGRRGGPRPRPPSPALRTREALRREASGTRPTRRVVSPRGPRERTSRARPTRQSRRTSCSGWRRRALRSWRASTCSRATRATCERSEPCARSARRCGGSRRGPGGSASSSATSAAAARARAIGFGGSGSRRPRRSSTAGRTCASPSSARAWHARRGTTRAGWSGASRTDLRIAALESCRRRSTVRARRSTTLCERLRRRR